MELFEKYYTAAVKFLSYRPRSIKEVKDNLLKKKASPEIIQKVIDTLSEQRFVNDEEFARWWTEQRTKFRSKSDKVIKLELSQKGIHRDIIEQIFSRDNADLASDIEKAKQLVEKRLRYVEGLPVQEQYQKLGAFLARRGFSWDTIRSAIDATLKKQYNHNT